MPDMRLFRENHNPRVGGSSPSSGIGKALRSGAFVMPGRSTRVELGPQLVPGNIPTRAYDRRPMRVPTGHVYRRCGDRGDVWYAKYRLPDGRQVKKRIGPAWTSRGRDRPPATPPSAPPRAG